MAISNFLTRKLQINSYVSDGFNNIKEDFNTAVIAGMGTNTILNILKSNRTPNKIILASNNELAKLRKEVNKLGYVLKAEKVILDNKHYYSIMLYEKGKQRLTNKEIKYGISHNQEYYQYLIHKNNEIIAKVPFKKKIKLKYENYILKGLTEKK